MLIIWEKTSHLGTVEASDERGAIAEAAKEFHISPARRHKILVTSTTLADLVYAAILCRDFFGSAGIAEAVA